MDGHRLYSEKAWGRWPETALRPILRPSTDIGSREYKIVGYFGKSSDTWYLRCRPCGAVPTTLAAWGTFRNRALRNTSRIKRVADAKDVQVAFVSQRSPARVAAGTTVRSLPSV